MNTNCGIYLIVSPSNGRYVGSSKNLKKRFNRYKNYSCKMQHALLSSLKKYGFENHEIKVLKYCEESELLFWERVFGDIYLSLASFTNGLNIRLPGYDDIPSVLTEESRQRVRDGCRRRYSNPDEIRKVSEKAKAVFSTPEARKSQSDKLKKVYESTELRKKRSELQKEYFKSAEAREHARRKTVEYFINNPHMVEIQQSGIKKYYEDNPNVRRDRQLKKHRENPNLGREHSEKLRKYYKDNPDARKAASERTKLQMANPENHHASKKVIDTETGEILPCIMSVAKRLNKAPQTVRNWLRGIVPNPTSYKLL